MAQQTAAKTESLSLNASDGKALQLYRWLPNGEPIATVQIAHGMGEHAARYEFVAGKLTEAGYAVYANDHRGHGRTAEPDLLGDMGVDGWNRVIQDAQEITSQVRAAHPGLPHVLLGHSMGSMLSQQYVYRFGDQIDALVLSGSPGLGGAFSLWLSHTIARIERWRHGPTGASPLLQRLLFSSSNKTWEGPGATGYEWLSRDPQQVQAYVDDPLCGFVLRPGSLSDLFAGAREARRASNIDHIPPALPIYVFSGAADPVHGEETNLKRLLKRYRPQVARLDYRLYPEGRHEMFNEINRDEVIGDLLNWLRGALLPNAGAVAAVATTAVEAPETASSG